MDAEKFLKEHIRMCLWYRKQEFGCCACFRYKKSCLAGDAFPDSFADVNLKEYVAGVEQWSNEHPQKTRQMDFMEKFPNAMICDNGTPKACCKHLGYTMDCPTRSSCKECWNKPMEEDDK